MKNWHKTALAVVSVVLLAGCSSKSSTPAEPITLKVAEMAFGSKEVVLEKGKAYELVLENQDSQLHDFSIDKIHVKVDGQQGEHSHATTNSNPDLHVQADAGGNGTITFTPTVEGTYTFYCTVPGHKDSGMVGQLVVK